MERPYIADCSEHVETLRVGEVKAIDIKPSSNGGRTPLQYKLASLLARRSLQRLWEGLYLVSLRGLGYNNPEAHLNGEHRFVRDWLQTRSSGPLVIVDAGANEGDFTACFNQWRHELRLFLFEPNPKTVLRLRKRFSDREHVHIVHAGLGNANGTLTLYDVDGSEGTQYASFKRGAIEVLASHQASAVSVPVLRLDDYCDANGIEAIDLLKIDTEGFEREVLSGSSRLIASHRIGAIQLEWNDINLLSGFSIYQLCEMLGGFQIYRIMPYGIKALVTKDHPYASRFDICRYSNLVCFDPDFGRRKQR